MRSSKWIILISAWLAWGTLASLRPRFFATKGKRVLGVDVVPEVVGIINQRKIHIEEPDLDVLVRAAVQSGNLTASINPAPADVYIIAVPTPFVHGQGIPDPDLSYVKAATQSLAPVVKPAI